ncbi:MAG TPA: hypothetical protein PLO69_15085 [Gammaproteobacteria bacterium]|nr:hypothetical protein [Gammaproteobacteria bacterium]
MEGSFQYVLTALYAFIASTVAGTIIWWSGWNRVDSIAALVVTGLMLKAGLSLVRESGCIFLLAAPRGIDPDMISTVVLAMPAVTRIDDLHVREVTSGMPALSAHVFAEHGVDCHDVRRRLETMLHEHFAITHPTIQTDHAAAGQCAAVACQFGSREAPRAS